jgi:heat shock protein HslJ
LLLGTVACGGRSDPAPGDLSLFLSDRTFLLDHAEGWAPIDGTTIRLQFSNDGLSFHAGCNYQGGAYYIQERALVISSLRTTAMLCRSDLHAQDDWVVGFLTGRPEVDLEGDRWLTLTGEAATLTFLHQVVIDADEF